MAINKTIGLTLDETILAAEKASRGLAEYENVLGILHFTKSVMDLSVSTLVSKRDQVTEEREARKNGFAELRRGAEAADAFIAKMIDRCRGFLGRSYNSSYAQLGLRSLGLPETHSYRLNVISSMATYLAGHTSVADPTQGITAVIATGAHETYRDALANVENLKTACRTAQAARDAALRGTQGTLRGLINELASKISPTDPRWRAFGFNCPGDTQAPGQVLNLVVSPGVARSLSLIWDTAPRGARYLVEMQLMAPEAEWTLVTTVAETAATLMDLTPGANVRLRVVAANDGGEGVPSEPVQAQVPVALAA
jgi:hypothetical protein